ATARRSSRPRRCAWSRSPTPRRSWRTAAARRASRSRRSSSPATTTRCRTSCRCWRLRRSWTCSWRSWTTRCRSAARADGAGSSLLVLAQQLPLVVRPGERLAAQQVAALAGPLALAQAAEDVGQVVQRLGLLARILVVDHVRPQELPARVLPLFAEVVAVAQDVVRHPAQL